jgi:hypothetical protein
MTPSAGEKTSTHSRYTPTRTRSQQTTDDDRVDDATGERKRFSSKILAPWGRKSPKIFEVLPLLHLPGLSSGDFVPALEQFFGGTTGLSPANVTRLTRQWSDDHAAFQDRDLSEPDYAYVWADGVHPKIRLGQAQGCVLVLLGVRLDGTKELIALAEGLRESTEWWADLLRDCRRGGMRDPEPPLKVTCGAGSPAAARNGVQAGRVRSGPLARDHRCPPGAPGPRRLTRFENDVRVEWS